ncbi:hypothetical protein GCM10011316_05580 [Roseibium aquae]|uniref:Uncharacterized protein n=1 Tax=Roseibium aquae TaxID=1323746 RepID=A0A916WWZ4_9HYPH|nr:hypothetical protein [Roseibium aquae]GGB36301.1 hypothetical protein GCM10011316_05580 [Roseibium aquae]
MAGEDPTENRGKGRARGTSEPQTRTPAEALKALLESSRQTGVLQSEYQAAYRSLPALLGVAGAILKKQQESEKALDEGLNVVEKVLSDASSKAKALSEDMSRQHDLLQDLLKNRQSLTELLHAGKNSGLFDAKTSDAPLSGGLAGINPQANPDPKVAYQLNILMSNLQSMVAREVESQLSQLRMQAEKMAQQSQ